MVDAGKLSIDCPQPKWLVAQGRILELGKAIERRAIRVGKSDTGSIRQWAEEIIELCDLLDKIENS